MLKTAVKRAMFGFMLGMAVGNLIAALTGHPNIVSPSLLQETGSLSAALLVQTIFSGVIGAVGMGGTVLYELERWPLLATDLVHFCLIMVAFIPIASFLGWIVTAKEILIMTAFMAAA
ncbi:MAG: DUF3021 domain-containing protein, partial [Oscillospiraceae bacterium]|nr:DUF3021 domain-containing protein [Oscillospiraceae bacterium]